MTVAFVLASWRPDVPAGMERAVIAHAVGLREMSHGSLIVTADPTAPSSYRNIPVHRLRSLNVRFPCDDATLRDAIDGSAAAIGEELGRLSLLHNVYAVVYIDALWGSAGSCPPAQVSATSSPRTSSATTETCAWHCPITRPRLSHRRRQS